MSAAPDHLSGDQALALALEWAARGFPVFPIGISWDAGKGSTVKRPLCPSPGYHLATTDTAKIRALFASAGPGIDEYLGVALVTGPAGVVVFDLDIKGKADGIAYADSIGLPSSTYNGTTVSGGRHRWFRKRAVEKVSNRVPEAWLGKIDVRSDNGYIVAPGTITPWGSWEAKGNLDDLPLVPEAIWNQLDAGSTAGSTSWRMFKPVHEAKLHPSTLAAHQLLVDRFGVDGNLTTFHESEGREPWLHVCRPGKATGISASLGRTGPGAMLVFSSNWPPFVADKVYSFDDMEALADRLEEGVDADDLARRNQIAERADWYRIDQAARQRVRAEELAERASFTRAIRLDEFDAFLAGEAARWGVGDEILWARGESLMIVGKTGVGKSWITLQVIRALCDGEPVIGVTLAGTEPLGYRVAPAQRILYLAADRPRQLVKMAKVFLEGVDPDRFLIWPGPTPVGPVGDPLEFLQWCREVLPGVDVVVFDSLKDFIPRPNTDEDAIAYNRTRQTLLAADIDVLELHHLRKGRGDGGSDDSFGSAMLVAGAGSMVRLDGEPGGETVVLKHLKQPQGMVGPLSLEHDRDNWITGVKGAGTVEGLIRAAGDAGITRRAILTLLHGNDPSDADKKRVNRRIAALIEDGAVVEVDGLASGPGRPPRLLKWVMVEFGTPIDSTSVPKGPAVDVPNSSQASSSTESTPSGTDRPEQRPEPPVPGLSPTASLDGLTPDEAAAVDPDWEDYIVSGQYEFDEGGKLRWIG